MAAAFSSAAVLYRAPTTVRVSASSGRLPTHAATVSISHFMSRLDALHLKAKNIDFSQAVVVSAEEEEVLLTFHFGDYRARMQHWWREHLEDRAALVQAACRDFSGEEEEDEVILKPPVSVDWHTMRYPAKKTETRV